MYQREALWLGFHAAAWKPNAVKVAVRVELCDARSGNFVGLGRWRNQFNPGPFRDGNEDTTPPDTRIFSPLAVARLCVPIGHYWYLFKRLTAVSAGQIYRFEHIVSYSSSKVVAKWDAPVPEFLKRGGSANITGFLRWRIQFNSWRSSDDER